MDEVIKKLRDLTGYEFGKFCFRSPVLLLNRGATSAFYWPEILRRPAHVTLSGSIGVVAEETLQQSSGLDGQSEEVWSVYIPNIPQLAEVRYIDKADFDGGIVQFARHLSALMDTLPTSPQQLDQMKQMQRFG